MIVKDFTSLLFPSFFLENIYYIYLFRGALYRILLELSSVLLHYKVQNQKQYLMIILLNTPQCRDMQSFYIRCLWMRATHPLARDRYGGLELIIFWGSFSRPVSKCISALRFSMLWKVMNCKNAVQKCTLKSDV